MRESSPPPYFDTLFARLQAGEEEVRAAFGRHVHWGYWSAPEQATLTPEDYGQAAERLCQQVCAAARIQEGEQVLDVGCGLGGTVASLSERYERLQLTGLNIDGRQLQYARQQVRPRSSQRMDWVEGDACQLPFEGSTFDVVLAVECIFHFDRRAFFAEAARVLRPGGRLALSDFCPIPRAAEYLGGISLSADPEVARSYGQIDLSFSIPQYEQLATDVGLRLASQQDITRQTLPTYDFLLQHAQSSDPEIAAAFQTATRKLAKLSRKELLQYVVLGFERGASPEPSAPADRDERK